MQTFYLLYKITNHINGKHYVGVHKTIDINDSYMGSGKILKRAIKKHGVENFTKDVLAIFDTPEEMYQMESIVVDAEFVRRDDTYNIKQGGNGGWDHVNNLPKDELTKSAIHANTAPNKRFSGKKHTRETIDKIVEANKIRIMSDDTRAKLSNAGKRSKGRVLSDDWKNKIGKANSKLQSGSGNSQYGTCWIYNEDGNKKIKKDELHQYLDVGYTKGRLSQFKK